jgi:hypothetical protein
MSAAGIITIGDSIIRRPLGAMAGVQPRSFGSLLAELRGLPYESLWVPGATLADVRDGLVPRVVGRHHLAIVSVGTANVRGGISERDFTLALMKILGELRNRCDRIALVGIPNDADASRIVEDAAKVSGAVFIPFDLLGSRELSSDRFHPTTLGHLALADRAAKALGYTSLPSQSAPRGGRGRVGVTYRLRQGGVLLLRAIFTPKALLGNRRVKASDGPNPQDSAE